MFSLFGMNFIIAQTTDLKGTFYLKTENSYCTQPDLSGQKCKCTTETYITEKGDTIQHGKYIWFISPKDGKPAETGVFKHGVKIESCTYQEGKLADKVIMYYPSGNTKEVYSYKAWGDGSLISKTKFDENGNEIK